MVLSVSLVWAPSALALRKSKIINLNGDGGQTHTKRPGMGESSEGLSHLGCPMPVSHGSCKAPAKPGAPWGSTDPLSEMNQVHAPRLSPMGIQERACPFLYGAQFQRAAHLLCPTKHCTSFFQASQKRKAFLLCTVVCRGLAGVQNHLIYLWGFQLTPVSGRRRPRPLAQAPPWLQAQLVAAVSVLLNIKGC